MRISDWSSDVCSSDLQADTASWFSGSADYEMDDSYKADYEEGRAAYDAEDYEDAVNRYGALAEAGVPEAAYELGKAYRYGNGVPKDTERAAQWLIAAVSRSHSRWPHARSEEHTSELQSLMRISYAVFCLKKKKTRHMKLTNTHKITH